MQYTTKLNLPIIEDTDNFVLSLTQLNTTNNTLEDKLGSYDDLKNQVTSQQSLLNDVNQNLTNISNNVNTLSDDVSVIKNIPSFTCSANINNYNTAVADGNYNRYAYVKYLDLELDLSTSPSGVKFYRKTLDITDLINKLNVNTNSDRLDVAGVNIYTPTSSVINDTTYATNNISAVLNLNNKNITFTCLADTNQTNAVLTININLLLIIGKMQFV